jgi:hypothetical protein
LQIQKPESHLNCLRIHKNKRAVDFAEMIRLAYRQRFE